jgi:tetraacyldisaccharide 4'-kinase
MRLKTPDFWYNSKSIVSKLKILCLWPLSMLYGLGFRAHQEFSNPYSSAIPVICIGNLVAGGSGKTPCVIRLGEILSHHKSLKKPVALSRGYGGREAGPLLVNEKLHEAGDVGDEPVLISKTLPCIVSKDRAEGAKMAEKISADLIVMDDGLQNTDLGKDIKIAVVDGTYGFGNLNLIPAGPLRGPLKEALKKIDAFILIGKDQTNISNIIPETTPVFEANIKVPDSWIYNQKTPYVAFAGMGQPEKFHSTLWSKGINVVGWHTFADHYPYSIEDINKLAKEANKKEARLITTEKDYVRIPSSARNSVAIDVMPVSLKFNDEDSFVEFLDKKIIEKRES